MALRAWQLSANVLELLHALLKQRAGYHQVDDPDPFVTHTDVDMRPCGRFLSHLFFENLNS